MVNTFLTYSPDSNGYRKSAASLDIQRLRKQCVEAKQICDIIELIYFLSDYMSIIPPDKILTSDLESSIRQHYEFIKWGTHIIDSYHAQPYYIAYINGQYVNVDKKRPPYVIKSEKYVVYDNGIVMIWPGKSKKQSIQSIEYDYRLYDFTNAPKQNHNLYPQIFPYVSNIAQMYILTLYDIHICNHEHLRDIIENWSVISLEKQLIYDHISSIIDDPIVLYRNDVVLPIDKIYKAGFSKHPAVYMWIGYEGSLCQYINDHIDIYLTYPTKTGKKRTMSINKYDIPAIIFHPWWSQIGAVIVSHRCSLLRKEIDRKEPRHYWNNSEFTVIDRYYLENLGYIWISHLTYEQSMSLAFYDLRSNLVEYCDSVVRNIK